MPAAIGNRINGIRVAEDCAGRKRGRLTICGARFRVSREWWCVAECECGSVGAYRYHSIAAEYGQTSSCGCRFAEEVKGYSRTHGHTAGRKMTSEYKTYHGMIQRCAYKNHICYSNYGGRGIKVCKRWADSFENFYADMGPKPSPTHSLDRIDPDGNYELGNCRWATAGEQAANRRSTVRYTFYGKTRTVAEWSRITQIPARTITERMRHGASPQVAFWAPPHSRWRSNAPFNKVKRVEFN